MHDISYSFIAKREVHYCRYTLITEYTNSPTIPSLCMCICLSLQKKLKN